MTILSLRIAMAASLVALSGATVTPVWAQDAPPPASANDGTLRVNQVVVYGDDECPQSSGEDIVVCGRLAEDERYRIPPELRGNPNDLRRESWTARVQSVERVGRTGTDSCSPAGLGGFTGCLGSLIDNAYAERDQAQGNDWTNAVAAARAERVAGFDAEAEAIEAQVTRDEAARVERENAAAAAAENAETDPDPSPLPSPLAVPPRP